MAHLKTKELNQLGYTHDKARSLAINILSKHFKHQDKAAQLQLLASIKDHPEDYVNDPVVGIIAGTFIEKEAPTAESISLLQDTGPLHIYGEEGIEPGARKQMHLAMTLPIAVQGALMPDAHSGFGLPIGGVLATRNAVIPYAVGMDIGCRMALTILDETPGYLKRYSHQVEVALRQHTHFGMEGGLDAVPGHEVLDSPRFQSLELLRKLQGKAAKQLGSSGSGNHFVEFGELSLFENNAWNLPASRYLALLSHSGSRGLGASIAQHFTRIAMDTCALPGHVRQLAWLDLDSEAGQEYWLSMNLAGDYARACHDTIRTNLLKALGLQALTTVENHHNFAWKEELAEGRQVVVHRKGATPAHEGEPGIIPGSMATPAYLVTGKGVEAALNSASHGAGRAMSRQKAKDNMTASRMRKMLDDAGVTLIGGSIEENPLAYKDIETVMRVQQPLISIQGRFFPRIVRMNRE